MAVTGSAPAVVVTQHKLIQPAPAVLTVIGSRPVQGTSARPVTAAFTVIGGTPTIRVSDNKTVQPSSADLTLTASAPEVSATANQFPTPAGAALTITGGTPVVTASDLKLIRPNPAALTVTGGIPTAGVGLTFVPSALSLSVTMSAPTVTATQNRFITPTNSALTITGGQPVVRAPRLVTPTNAALTVTGGTPTVTVGVPGAHYTDDFNRANSSTLGSDWVTDAGYSGSLEINSNAAVTAASPGDQSGNIYALPMLTGNNQITVVMKGSPTAGDGFALMLMRCNNNTDSTAATAQVGLAMLQGSTWTLFRFAGDSGVSTAGNVSWADGDTVLITAVGATLTVKLNGSTVLTTGGATDIAAGYVALGYASTSGTGGGFNSFDAQDI
jgi:hypothetical protein